MARRGTRGGRKSKRDEPEIVEGFPTDDPRSTNRLERALRAAELEDAAGPDGEGPREETSSSSSEVPPPDPAALVAFTETLRGQALKIYAGVIGLDVTEPRVAAVFTFSESERRTLELWAPYAAKYVPVLIGQSDEVGAWIYVGTTVASLWTGMGELRRLAPKKARNASDPFPGPGDPKSSSATPSPSSSPLEVLESFPAPPDGR
jgi:hypothetical protein